MNTRLREGGRRSSRRRLFLPAAALLLLAAAPQVRRVLEPGQGVMLADYPEVYDAFGRFVYFAVLEGLYEDGVGNDVVDAVLSIDPETKLPQNFVWSCPLCMPAYQAFLHYRQRPPLQGLKFARDTFGSGLTQDLRVQLLAFDAGARLEALEELLRRWVARRMEAQRFTPEEAETWQQEFEKRRKLGMAALQDYQTVGSYRGMERCAVCDGTNGACGG